MSELAELPLDAWTAMYQAVQARRLEDAALSLSVTHASKPKQMRQHLIDAASRIAAGYRGGIAKDPAKLRKLIATIPGVKVENKVESKSDG